MEIYNLWIIGSIITTDSTPQTQKRRMQHGFQVSTCRYKEKGKGDHTNILGTGSKSCGAHSQFYL